MESWIINTENYINVIYPDAGTITAFYATPENDYTRIPGEFTKVGSDRYYIKYTFGSTGTYIIKITDSANIENTVTNIITVIEDKLSDIIGTLDTPIKANIVEVNNNPIDNVTDFMVNPSDIAYAVWTADLPMSARLFPNNTLYPSTNLYPIGG